jgi:hypothetical protein
MATTQKSALRRDAGVERHGRGRRRGWLTGGTTTGNELLTSAVGATLIVLLAVIGITILRIGQLLWVYLVLPEFGPWVNHVAFHHGH